MRAPRHVLKGHGTENDFVLVPDPDGEFDLDAGLVRALCDRRAGVGGDGVLRVVRTARVAGFADLADRAEWFMDYRNSDGSTAEMCGNGIRVFFRYLQRTGLVEQEAAVATRGGIMRVRPSPDGSVAVEFGQPQVLADRPVVTAAPSPSGAGAGPGTTVAALLVPNPHVVVEVAQDELTGLDLTRPPDVAPSLPDGQNVEFVVRVADRHLRMRVHERGSGETRSCGTGIVAAAVAVATADGAGPDGQPWRVDVPGGTCHVTWTADAVTLSGPAVLVGEIELDHTWWESVNP